MALTLSAVFLLAVPVLGAVGFTAAGPAADSAAAAWQVLIEAVKTGSLFAWCQSAAIGRAAAGSTVITKVVNVPGLAKMFKSVCC